MARFRYIESWNREHSYFDEGRAGSLYEGSNPTLSHQHKLCHKSLKSILPGTVRDLKKCHNFLPLRNFHLWLAKHMKSKMIVRVISHDKRKEITEQATIKRFEDKKNKMKKNFI